MRPACELSFPMTITLVVLDLAGTTVRDDGVVERAFVRAVEGSALPGTLDDALRHVRDTMGQSKIDVFGSLYGDEAAAVAANERFEEAVAEELRGGGLGPLPGAEEALARLREDGRRVCLTTGFSARTRDDLLEVLGWRDRVDLVLGPDEDLRGRPFPDLVLAAVLRLRVDDVADVAVAGDTASDLLSGSRAGAGVVAGVLTGAHDRATLSAAPHTHILESVRDLPDVVQDVP